MKVKELLTESLDRKQTYSILLKFIEFAAREIGLDQLPKFDFKFDSDRAVEFSSFGGYGGGHINITVKNRHINDVCRTLAHEMVHFKQDLEGRIKHDSGATGSPIENEANAQAAIILRKWGKMHPELFRAESI